MSNFNIESNLSIEDLKRYIYWWNNKYPFDRWWREKYNIPFNSKKHKQASPIDQRLEYEEERLFKELPLLRERQKRELEEQEIHGRFLRTQRRHDLGAEGADEMFEDFDMDDYYDKDTGEIKDDVNNE